MNKKIFGIITFFMIALIGTAYSISSTEAWSDAGMGYSHELAEQINSAIAGAGSGAEQVAIMQQITNQYYGATGVKGDFDHDGIPDNQQSSAPAATTQPSQEKETTTEKTEKTEEPKTEESETEEPEETPEVHEHDYIKEITKEPTCTEEGLATYTCECGDSYTESIPAKGHTEGSWETISEPTCTEDGKKQIKCTICGEVLKEESIPAKGHVEGNWEVTKPADWIHDGEQVKKCTVCNEILETEVLPANHTPLFIIGGCVLGLIVIVVAVISKKSANKSSNKPKTAKKPKKDVKNAKEKPATGKASELEKPKETKNMSTVDKTGN